MDLFDNDEPGGSSQLICMTWVRQSAAQEVPDKIQLSNEELTDTLKTELEKTTVKVKVEVDSDVEVKEEFSDSDDLKEFDMDNYDNEDDQIEDSLSSLFMFANNKDDPYITNKENSGKSENELEEEEAVKLKMGDNLLVCGRCERDCSLLEVHLYNHETKDFYVHHDIPLSATPLCIEWLDFDAGSQPTDASDKGNFAAVGNMNSLIEVWDLDVLNTIEPAFVLGIPMDKQGDVKSDVGYHTDAIMDLSWNNQLRHIMASSSADHKVALWDLREGCQARIFSKHKEKVQAIEWRPQESNCLLSGACDGRIIAFDQRSDAQSSCVRRWKVKGEIERVAWNQADNFYFAASTEHGSIFYYDFRQPGKSLHHWRAHERAIPSLSLSSDLLYSASSDGHLKAWRVGNEDSSLLFEKDMKMGMVHCFHKNPDLSYLLAIGGEKGGIRLWNAHSSQEVSGHLGIEYFAPRNKDFFEKLKEDNHKTPGCKKNRLDAKGRWNTDMGFKRNGSSFQKPRYKYSNDKRKPKVKKPRHRDRPEFQRAKLLAQLKENKC